jgi:hypothetical protein
MAIYSGSLFYDSNATFTLDVRLTRLVDLSQTIDDSPTYDSFSVYQGKTLNMTVELSDLDGIDNVSACLVNSFGTRIPVSVATFLQNHTYALTWLSTINSYSGTYTLRITVTDISGTKTVFTSTVTVQEDSLHVVIVSPSTGALYKVGDTVTITANATYLSGTPFDGSIVISIDGNSYTATKTPDGLWTVSVQLTVAGNITVTAIARSTAAMVSATSSMMVSQQTNGTTSQNQVIQVLGSSLPALVVVGVSTALLGSLRYSVRKRRNRGRRSESWELAIQYRDTLFSGEREEE